MTSETEAEVPSSTAPWANRILSTIEVVTVVLLAIAIFFAIFCQVFWIVFGTDVQPLHARLSDVAKSLIENWKAGLLLLIPLFYRSIRSFLERVEEFAGMKTRQAELQSLIPNPNPASVPIQKPKSEKGV